MHLIKAIAFTVCCSTLVNIVSGIAYRNDANDLVYTPEEKTALVMFQLMMNDSLTEDFMKTDFYLIRWIRMTNYDLIRAQKLLLQTIQWRKENNIMGIMQEDFSDVEQNYHILFAGRDKQGRPIGCIDLGDWALNKANKGRLVRYLAYSLEKGMQDVLEIQQENNGTNPLRVSRGRTLIDLQNMGFRTHLCSSCLSILTQWMSMMETHYPKLLTQIVLVNAPTISTIAINILRPFMSKETKETMMVFNGYKKAWMEYLDERIEREQRTLRYGGSL